MSLYVKEELNTIDDPVRIVEDIQGMRDAIERLRNGELSDEEFRRYRLHRGIYGQRADQQGFNMVRVKVPYGLLTSKQLIRLGEIARTFADGIAHVTTRQDIQLHWVQLQNIPAVMESLADVGLTTREACGNSVRNIVGSPLAGVAKDELFDVTPYARLLAKHLLRNSLSQQLPRKFKISFSGSSDESDAIVPWIHDIGFVASLKQEDGIVRKGFRVFVGGGLGSQPRVADVLEEFMPVEQLIPTAEAILAIFNTLGNRENRNKARMKFVLWKLGLDGFRHRVNEERLRILQLGRVFTTEEESETGYLPLQDGFPGYTKASIEFQRWADFNVISQKQDEYNVVYVNPTIGDLTTDQLFSLSDLANRFSNGNVRTTTQQDIVLRWIRSSDLVALYQELKRVGLHQAGAQTIANVTSCPGADTCNLGITHSRALGKELTQLFLRTPDWIEVLKDLRIKISGCPNSCGQHHIASIGFYGAAKNVNGRQIPSYIMMIGGGLNSGGQSFADTIGKIPARYIVEAVSRILRTFLTQRTEDENFWQYVERVGVRSFREEIKDLVDIRSEQANDDLFIDLGEKSAFIAKTGVGECAV
ncbi:MAG: nitrite/sulfite reductase [Ignavibacteria bacterium]|nr:nitrite/sulfite reductase [Ignavibacteria bacterium]MBI3765150.1 nitrite/sulfite reductase [Ignavibacteriales bacterium]